MTRVCILSSVHLALDNRVFYREARSLQRAGYEVILIAVHGRDEIKDGVHIRGLPDVPRKRRPLLWRRLLRMAREEAADLYHFHDPELLLVTPWLRRQTGRPTIYDVHEVYADFIKVKDYMPAWLRYPIAWNFRWLEPLLARLQSLFNFPALSFVRQAVAATGPSRPREPIILYLGGMERNRGTTLMVEAFARVRQAAPAARLLLVGHFMPPALEDEVRQRAQRLRISDALTIIGRVPFEQIGAYLQQAAVGWVSWQPVPKNEKNIPTKLFEYMAYGIPVVSSDLPSTRQFVDHGENGLLVPAGDPVAHAAAILEILEHPQKGARMGRRGQELVQTRYNWGEMEKRLLALYADLLAAA